MANQVLRIELDGANLHPHTVEVPSTLELAAAYVDLLRRIAVGKGGELALVGLAVKDKCFQFEVGVDDADLAEASAVEVDRYMRGALLPGPGLAKSTERLRKAAKDQRALGRTIRISIRDWSEPLEVAAPKFDLLPEAIIALRVKLISVGGAEPRIRVEAASEPDAFDLRVTEAEARELGKHLYLPVDVVAAVKRDAQGMIVSGRLREFHPMQPGDASAEWLKWLDAAGEDWNGVTDILGELGRD